MSDATRRDLLRAVAVYREARDGVASRPRWVAIAQLHVAGNALVTLANALVAAGALRRAERDPDRAAALAALEAHHAVALGRSVDTFLDDAVYRAHHAAFVSVARVRGRRDPERVAGAASLVLARIAEVLTGVRRSATLP
jgi:hypothetical protein